VYGRILKNKIDAVLDVGEIYLSDAHRLSERIQSKNFRKTWPRAFENYLMLFNKT
jgi:hypothetical protein